MHCRKTTVDRAKENYCDREPENYRRNHGPDKTCLSWFLAELPRFENSRNVELTFDYFFSPSRRRSSLKEIAPSFFVWDRERSMIARNLRFVLRDTVSSSAFRIGTTAAKGFPRFTIITGSFLAF